MQRYLGIVSYSGLSFYGWAKQPNFKTVQGLLEEQLSLILQTPIRIFASGRTDKGVHAYNQTFHVDLPKTSDPKTVCKKLNQLTFPHCFVKALVPVAANFHARFWAKTKVYEYQINTGSFNPMQYDYVWQFNQPLDLKKLQEATKLFLGKKDFLSFSVTRQTATVRIINKITVQQDQHGIVKLTFWGNGFLRCGVRMIVACLVAVATEQLTPTVIKEWFLHPKKGACQLKAPAAGLYLKTVLYG